jgi:putative molybdopterin biosynthesis protein
MRGAVGTEELRAPPPAEALAAWARACGERSAGAPEIVRLEDALGRVSHGPVRALRSSPAYPAAAMDGIAARATDAAEAPADLTAFAVVDTGDPLPARYDTVVAREELELDGEVARVAAPPARGQHVRPVGEDVAAGELLFAPGHRLGPFDLALAAAGGHGELAVRRPPTVTILPTGDELRPAGTPLADGELADTNSIMLEAQAREAGFRTVRGAILPDDADRLAAAVEQAAASSDLVLLVAGTSAGRHDLAPDVLRRCGSIVARGVAMRPGHPAVLAVVDGTPVMGCPGYPVSAALAFDRLARPLLERRDDEQPAAPAVLGTAMTSKRGVLEHVRVATGRVDGRRVAVALRRGASVLSALARADGIVTVPAGVEGLPAGAEVRVEPLRGAAPDRLLIAGPPDRALDHLLVACAEAGLAATLCEMPAADALALATDRGCHAAWVYDTAAGGPLSVVDIAEREVGIAVAEGDQLGIGGLADLARPDVRAVGGPSAPEGAIPMRCDDAAIDAVVRGHADCAFAGVHASRTARLVVRPTGRVRLGLAIRHDARRREPALAALLELIAGAGFAAALAADGHVPARDPARAA